MPAQNITLTAKWNENPADYTDYDIAVAAANAKKAEANYDKTYTETSRKLLTPLLQLTSPARSSASRVLSTLRPQLSTLLLRVLRR